MPSYTFTENSTAQNSADTPITGVTEDVGISQPDPTSNQDPFGAFEIGRFSSSENNNILIAFDTSSIIDTETVTAVGLYLHMTAADAGHLINVYENLRTGTTEGGATWNTYDGTNSWTTAGARGSGTDRSSSPVGSTSVSATANEYKSFSLLSSVINKTGFTYLIMEMDAGEGESGDFTQWSSSEFGSDGIRPELVVTTTAGGGGIIPLISHHIRQMRQ